MGPELDDPAAALVSLLPELAVVVYESAPHRDAVRRGAGRELTARQMAAVVALARRPGATMSELAAALGVGRAAASELVERLVQKGVVQRVTDATDRRAVRLDLSPRARALAEAMQAGWRAEVEAAFDDVPGLDPTTLIAFLDTLLDRLKGHRPR
ncbi:MAG: winged helix-turn-helix transcriptional regulator [Thermoleophilia bacterium]|nr:winged helix-turn-helix transcriptional regulator [Thermoleophilia bacterium]